MQAPRTRQPPKCWPALLPTRGDSLRYYATAGEIRVVNPSKISGPQPVEFYVETLPAGMPDAWVKDAQGREIPLPGQPPPARAQNFFCQPP